MEELKALLYQGKVSELVKRQERRLERVPKNGPGNKGLREALAKLIGYMKPRRYMMKYGSWLNQDLVIASDQVEGAVRHLVGEHLDCSGMRWIRAKAEAVLHLRCIELNGDWKAIVDWFQRETQKHLNRGKRPKVLTNQPLPLANIS